MSLFVHASVQSTGYLGIWMDRRKKKRRASKAEGKKKKEGFRVTVRKRAAPKGPCDPKRQNLSPGINKKGELGK